MEEEMNYPKIAFTEKVKEQQEKNGSRQSYERMENYRYADGFTQAETGFISYQDNFYIASISESGFPYIQFRGGPKGFLKVLDKQTLGFLDFSGNKQYITTGNASTNDKISLFLIDQVSKNRLKIFATAEILPLVGNETLGKKLELKDYKYKAERIYLLHVKAYDWNCQQHITPRFTIEEIQEQFDLQRTYIDTLVKENKELKAKLKNQL